MIRGVRSLNHMILENVCIDACVYVYVCVCLMLLYVYRIMGLKFASLERNEIIFHYLLKSINNENFI